MTTRSFLAALTPAFILGFSAPAMGADANQAPLTAEENAQLRALLAKQKAGASAEKGSAPERTSFIDGLTAGWEKGKFFIKSEDGKYLMNIYGKIQARYNFDSSVDDGAPANASSDKRPANGGFELRRMNLDVSGKLGSSAGYMLELENRIGPNDYVPATGGVNTNNNSMFGILKAYGIVNLAEGFSMWVGRIYLPFEREFLISSGAQVAAERSELNNQFSIGTAEGVQFNLSDDTHYKAMVAFSNGANSNSVNWDKNPNHFAVTARGEWLALGAFADTNDNLALADADKQGLIFGLAGYWQMASSNGGSTPVVNNATGATLHIADDTAYGATFDALYKVSSLSFYGAANIAGAQAATALPAGYRSPLPWGLEGQIDWRFSKEASVFGQYSHIDPDLTTRTGNNKPLNIAAVGINYFMSPNVKFTGDVSYVFSGDKPAGVYGPSNGAVGGGSGYTTNNSTTTHPRLDGQVAVRLQCQVSF